MTDPTKQAATANTAREVIAEAADVIQALIKAPFLAPARVAALESEKSLRALLDAPEGGAERLCEAAEKVMRIDGADMCFAGQALKNAIKDYRASPEAVGGAGVSVEATGFRYPETVARVNAALEAERAKTAEAVRERDEVRAAYSEVARAVMSTNLMRTYTSEPRDYAAAIADVAKERDSARTQRDEALKFLGERTAERDAEKKRADSLDCEAGMKIGALVKERDALKARLDAIAKGYGDPFATPEERVEYCERGRETLVGDLKTLRAELAAVSTSVAPLSDRAKWVAQYIKEHVSRDEDSARVLAQEGAEILRIAEQAVRTPVGRAASKCPICDGGNGSLCDSCFSSLDRCLPAGRNTIAGYAYIDYISWAARRAHRQMRKQRKAGT